MTLLKWQQEEIERLSKLPDAKLLEEVLEDAAGDDYDGCFTTRGAWMFEKSKVELYKRLPKSFMKVKS